MIAIVYFVSLAFVLVVTSLTVIGLMVWVAALLARGGRR